MSSWLLHVHCCVVHVQDMHMGQQQFKSDSYLRGCCLVTVVLCAFMTCVWVNSSAKLAHVFLAVACSLLFCAFPGYAYGSTAANAQETLIFSAILVLVVRTAVWAFMHVLQKRFEYVALQRQLMLGKNATANGLTPAPTPHLELAPLMKGAWIVSLSCGCGLVRAMCSHHALKQSCFMTSASALEAL